MSSTSTAGEKRKREHEERVVQAFKAPDANSTQKAFNTQHIITQIALQLPRTREGYRTLHRLMAVNKSLRDYVQTNPDTQKQLEAHFLQRSEVSRTFPHYFYHHGNQSNTAMYDETVIHARDDYQFAQLLNQAVKYSRFRAETYPTDYVDPAIAHRSFSQTLQLDGKKYHDSPRTYYPEGTRGIADAAQWYNEREKEVAHIEKDGYE